jgi:hypothetical protein
MSRHHVGSGHTPGGTRSESPVINGIFSVCWLYLHVFGLSPNVRWTGQTLSRVDWWYPVGLSSMQDDASYCHLNIRWAWNLNFRFGQLMSLVNQPYLLRLPAATEFFTQPRYWLTVQNRSMSRWCKTPRADCKVKKSETWQNEKIGQVMSSGKSFLLVT